MNGLAMGTAGVDKGLDGLALFDHTLLYKRLASRVALQVGKEIRIPTRLSQSAGPVLGTSAVMFGVLRPDSYPIDAVRDMTAGRQECFLFPQSRLQGML